MRATNGRPYGLCVAVLCIGDYGRSRTPVPTDLCVAVLCIGDAGHADCPRFASASICRFAAIADVVPYRFVRSQFVRFPAERCGVSHTL